jgi:hypothetical protein
LASILKYATKIDGVLFDLPYAIGEAKTAWPQVYPESLNRRVSFAAGSFFNASDIPNPPGGPRCYVLRVVLHDWDDAHCVQILSNIAKRVRPGDSVVIVESIPEEFGNLPSVTTMDIVMATFRGKERTREALDQLFVKSGLDPSNVLLHTRSLFRVAVSTKKQ